MVSAEELGASAAGAESSDASVVTAEVVDGNVKVTSKKEGSATVTATADGYSDATISVTVSADGKIKTEVTQKFEPAGDPNFPSKTNSDTANNETTLGLVGTDTNSSNPSVATAKIEGDKEATIEVTVGSTGIITIGKITKYRAPTDMSKATVLINYPAKKDGITLTTPASNGPEYTTVKIHTNTDDVNCLSFKGSGADKGVILSVNGGFKAGDEIEIAGVFNNADDKKQAAVAISNGGDTLFTTKDFINGRNIADDPESETYVLEADAESLVLSRSGNTATNITLLKVTRPSAE